jgi:hypothetical protein
MTTISSARHSTARIWRRRGWPSVTAAVIKLWLLSLRPYTYGRQYTQITKHM